MQVIDRQDSLFCVALGKRNENAKNNIQLNSDYLTKVQSEGRYAISLKIGPGFMEAIKKGQLYIYSGFRILTAMDNI